MNEEFKRLKRWVEECPVEAAMRIEELEIKQNDYTENLNETRRKRDEVKGKLEVVLKDNKGKNQLIEAMEKEINHYRKALKYYADRDFQRAKDVLEDYNHLYER